MRLRLASRELQLLGAEKGSVRSQTRTPFSHIHPIPDRGQPPHVSRESSPAPLPPASPLTPIPQSCHWLPDHSCLAAKRRSKNMFCNSNPYLRRIFETSGPGIYSGSKCGLPELFLALFLLSFRCVSCMCVKLCVSHLGSGNFFHPCFPSLLLIRQFIHSVHPPFVQQVFLNLALHPPFRAALQTTSLTPHPCFFPCCIQLQTFQGQGLCLAYFAVPQCSACGCCCC